MDWAEDLKMTLKKTVKKGRRATEQVSNVSSESPSTPDYDANFQENALSDEFSSTIDFKSIPLKAKKITGWTDEPRSGSSGKSRTKQTANELERFNTILATSPPSDDIPVLPDLEDVMDEAALNDTQPAQAIAVDRVETYKELNSELLKYSAFASSENIDLSRLMKCLQDESVLSEHDVPLTTEQLFNEIASYVHSCHESKLTDESAQVAE